MINKRLAFALAAAAVMSGCAENADTAPRGIDGASGYSELSSDPGGTESGSVYDETVSVDCLTLKETKIVGEWELEPNLLMIK